ncbi:CHRD domain-containing protein [Sphingomonas sp. LaA6.9]|uniref:CHRD domain-containing protein n=1 Tax=Sphingomonas sp. LaA6.9 TaxID=2919914 RepID=UPI001F4F6E72|nr:CHRD domain-containing protein [Sphingomonas sp. LaA6.9]MCJ8156682.1 CHRD domain-containing protein [Sphingomonas sp. LaA6.9]
MKILLSALLLAPVALAAGAVAPAQQGGRPISVSMTGAAEVPGPGDADGSGTASFRINPGQTQVCYELAVKNIETATAAHIHRGAPDVAGPVVVPLDAPASGTSKGCADIDRALAKELIQTPAAFYVNVHNAPHPAGAVRGQLGK